MDTTVSGIGAVVVAELRNLAGIKRFHAIVPVLADGDEELVVRACASGVVSARDAAITLLALSTGLRACDIVALRMGDVDWRGRTIGLVQCKTGNPLTLPLPALLLSKLASYVLDERPSSSSVLCLCDPGHDAPSDQRRHPRHQHRDHRAPHRRPTPNPLQPAITPIRKAEKSASTPHERRPSPQILGLTQTSA